MTDISIIEACIYGLLGYILVFTGLALLMCVVALLGKFFARKSAKTTAPAPATISTPEVAPATAPGSAGQLKLYNVEPKTAAMVMAIVADKMGKPINELRFISIKEVTE
jgi:Na+-transporting methylmalonyl-CoA/oxaloacetate decarboxylase gamma subunit